jgi:hypothetical protein
LVAIGTGEIATYPEWGNLNSHFISSGMGSNKGWFIHMSAIHVGVIPMGHIIVSDIKMGVGVTWADLIRVVR